MFGITRSPLDLRSGSAPLLLDLYSGSAVAYSLRKLRNAYTGACIRVRRSSDNTEQDIGFVSNVLDTATLLTFCGAGNGFVTAWYNQSSNANNVTQSTSTAQPRIVNAGVLDGVVFDGSNDFLSTAFPDLDTLTLSCWIRSTATSEQWIFTQSSTAAGGYKGITLVPSGTVRMSFSDGATSAFNQASSTVNNGALRHVAITFQSGELKLYVNGTLEATATGLSDAQSWNLLTLGALVRNGNLNGIMFFAGTVQEAVAFSDAKSGSDIAAIYAAGVS